MDNLAQPVYIHGRLLFLFLENQFIGVMLPSIQQVRSVKMQIIAHVLQMHTSTSEIDFLVSDLRSKKHAQVVCNGRN